MQNRALVFRSRIFGARPANCSTDLDYMCSARLHSKSCYGKYTNGNETMNEALILEKLDNLASEIQSLKSEVQAFKDAKPVPATSAQPAVSASVPMLAKFDGKYNEKDLDCLVENLLISVNDINSMLFKMKAGNELCRDIEPIAHQVYPHLIKFLYEIEGAVTLTDFEALLRNLLISVPAMNEALGFLRAGIELTDDLMPVAKIVYPKVIVALNELQQAIDNSGGIIKVVGAAASNVKEFTISEEQAEEIIKVMNSINFNNIKPVSPIGAVKQLMNPDVQKSLGAAFMMLQSMGACVQIMQKK